MTKEEWQYHFTNAREKHSDIFIIHFHDRKAYPETWNLHKKLRKDFENEIEELTRVYNEENECLNKKS